MSNWEEFEFEIRYDSPKLQSELITIEAYRLSLNKLVMPADWLRDLQNLAIVRAVHGTTAIEGNPLRQEEVANQLDSDMAISPRDRVHRQTANAAEAFSWIDDNFREPRPIRCKDIRQIHILLTTDSDEKDNSPGQMRRGGHNVTVGSPDLGGVHRAPPGGECLDRLVREFFVFINSRRFKAENTVIQALTAHFYFVTLHPFGDGNGRSTRCLEAAILYSGGYNTHGFYSLSNFFYRNRDEYFQLLQETRTRYRYDLTEFLAFGLRGFREELDRINAYVRNRTHRLQYRDLIRRSMEKRVSPRRKLLNEREARLLHRILDISKPPDPYSDNPAREAMWPEIWEFCSHLYVDRTARTIIRELRRLEELGFIEFRQVEGKEDWRVLLDFQAIRRY